MNLLEIKEKLDLLIKAADLLFMASEYYSDRHILLKSALRDLEEAFATIANIERLEREYPGHQT
jgi:hypothetical protein